MILLFKVKREEEKERYIQSAFVGWQMGAGAGKKFGEYIEGLGLSEKGTRTTPDKVTAKEAIAKAEEILRMAAKKKE